VREPHLEDATSCLGEVSKLTVTDARNDWAADIKRSTLPLRGVPAKEVTLTRSAKKWLSSAIAETADRWSAQGSASHHRRPAADERNVALVRFDLDDPIVLPGDEAKLQSRHSHDTPNAITGMQAVLTGGDSSRPLLPDLAPVKS